MYIYIYIYIHGKWLQFVAANKYRGVARRAQQVGYATEHICRSDFSVICFRLWSDVVTGAAHARMYCQCHELKPLTVDDTTRRYLPPSLYICSLSLSLSLYPSLSQSPQISAIFCKASITNCAEQYIKILANERFWPYATKTLSLVLCLIDPTLK